LTALGLAEAGFLLGFLLAHLKPGGTPLSKAERWLAGVLGSLMAIGGCGTAIEQIGLELRVATITKVQQETDASVAATGQQETIFDLSGLELLRRDPVGHLACYEDSRQCDDSP